MSLTYFELRVFNVPKQMESSISELCLEAGAQGISEDLDFSQPDLVYEATPVEKDFLTLTAFFETAPDQGLLGKLRELRLEFKASEKPHEDWMEGWKKHFKAFQLIGPYWVVPSWLPVPSDAGIALRIDPGMAFGTGTHATTQLASQLIVEDSELFAPKSRALDVGTGTAILAMLLKHSGFLQVDATEIDPIARETGRENVALNSISGIEVLDCQIEELQTEYDLVVANIVDGILVRLKEDLVRLTRPGGYLILTGILEERKEDFLIRFLAATDLEIVRAVHKDEWWGFLAKKG